ncbi:hypothetical protein BD311DRAFT_3769 [Dichomitus squalens]|uniref:Uncharacterized protein n=1 Tax=Dichomitus squalens TaxID=114155 RepID=A0A4Q9N7Y2_9APHY|nr:hypothetical protein BD311DRAFT_3769 [Dichomitus squalens]
MEEEEVEAGAYSAERASASPSSSSDLVRVCGTVLAGLGGWGVLNVGDELFKGTKAKAEWRDDWSGSSVGVWCGVPTRAGLDWVLESMVTMNIAVERRAQQAKPDRGDWARVDDGRSIRRSQTAAWLLAVGLHQQDRGRSSTQPRVSLSSLPTSPQSPPACQIL